MRHSVIVEPYVGTGAYAPQYGPPVTVKCFRNDEAKLVKTTEGDEVMSVATLYCPLTANVPVHSRVTLPGNPATYTVITSRPQDGGGLPTVDHLEVTL